MYGHALLVQTLGWESATTSTIATGFSSVAQSLTKERMWDQNDWVAQQGRYQGLDSMQRLSPILPVPLNPSLSPLPLLSLTVGLELTMQTCP